MCLQVILNKKCIPIPSQSAELFHILFRRTYYDICSSFHCFYNNLLFYQKIFNIIFKYIY